MDIYIVQLVSILDQQLQLPFLHEQLYRNNREREPVDFHIIQLGSNLLYQLRQPRLLHEVFISNNCQLKPVDICIVQLVSFIDRFQQLRLCHGRFASNNRKLEPMDVHILQLYRKHLLLHCLFFDTNDHQLE